MMAGAFWLRRYKAASMKAEKVNAANNRIGDDLTGVDRGLHGGDRLTSDMGGLLPIAP